MTAATTETDSGAVASEPLQHREMASSALDPTAEVGGGKEEKEVGTYWNVEEGTKRAKKAAVDVYKVEDTRDKKVEIKEGKGDKLSDLANVVENLKAVSQKDPVLKHLHHLMFAKPAKATEVKGNLLSFSGLVYDESSKGMTRAKMLDKAQKYAVADLKKMADVLGADRSHKSTKDEVAEALVSWLEKPTAGKLKVNQLAKAKAKGAGGNKRKSSGSKKGSGSSSKASASPAKKKKPAAAKKKKAKEEDDEEEEELDEEVEDEEDEDDEDYEDDGEAKKKRKRKAANGGGKKKKAKEEAGADGDEEEGPQDDDVTVAVKDIMSKVDPQQVTIKQVMSQLSEALGRDVSSEKARVKELVTSLLSS